eukprot:1422612-Prymnesium_polylepis.2
MASILNLFGEESAAEHGISVAEWNRRLITEWNKSVEEARLCEDLGGKSSMDVVAKSRLAQLQAAKVIRQRLVQRFVDRSFRSKGIHKFSARTFCSEMSAAYCHLTLTEGFVNSDPHPVPPKHH